MSPRLFRRFGDSAVQLDLEGVGQERLRAWLGVQGWMDALDEPASRELCVAVQGERARVSGVGEAFEGSVDWCLSEMEYQLLLHAMEMDDCALHLHAALVGPPDGAMAIVAPHMGGKTTMALALNELGHPVYGDDVLRVGDDGRVASLPRPLRLRPFTQSLLDDERRALALDDQVEEILRIDPLRVGGAAATWVQPTRLVFCSFRAGADFELEELPSQEALQALLEQRFESAGEPSERVLSAVLALLGRARPFRLSHGLSPLDAAARLIEGVRE